MNEPPIEESIQRVMQSFRHARLVWMRDNHDDVLPEHLKQHAEAHAIAELFPPMPRTEPPPPE